MARLLVQLKLRLLLNALRSSTRGPDLVHPQHVLRRVVAVGAFLSWPCSAARARRWT